MGQKKGGRGRGGRRHFVTSAEDLEKRNATLEASQRARAARRADDDDEEDEDGDEELENVEERNLQMQRLREEVSGIEGGAMRKAKGVEGVIKTANPNASKAHLQHKKARDLDGDADAPQLTRREREELEKARAAEAYRKLHAEGKTDEYKADMERLKAARKRREDEESKRTEAEVEAKTIKHAAKMADNADDDEEELDARAIKQLKPAQLKEHLKAKGLSTQGQKKELIERLIAAL